MRQTIRFNICGHIMQSTAIKFTAFFFMNQPFSAVKIYMGTVDAFIPCTNNALHSPIPLKVLT